MDYLEELERLKRLTDIYLLQILDINYPERLYEAMAYSTFAGGKRLRPVLLLASNIAHGGNEIEAMPFACAIEMIHTYSLIHDDLPAIDNDEFRRGRLSCHMQFDEATAILAGDGLLNGAYEVMSGACSKGLKGSVEAMCAIAQAAGSKGMIGGQMVDIISERKDAKRNEDTLLYIHGNKTAALIIASLKAGAMLAGASNEQVALMEQAGLQLGIAFQIKDDILNATSTTEQLGKTAGSDEKNNKFTYISMYGMQKAKDDYDMLSRSAIKQFNSLDNPFLGEFAQMIFDRSN